MLGSLEKDMDCKGPKKLNFFFLSGHSVCVRSVINELNFLLHYSVARELWSLVILCCGS